MLKEKGRFFSALFLLLAWFAVSLHPLSFPWFLQVGALLIWLFASLGGGRSLFWGAACISGLFVWKASYIFSTAPYFIFFSIAFCSSLMAAMDRSLEIEKERQEREEYEALQEEVLIAQEFSKKCLEEAEKIGSTLGETELELQEVQKQRLEEFLEEDSGQKVLMDLLEASQEKCANLSQEVKFLEEILLKISKDPPNKRASSKKKKKEENVSQGILF